MTEAIEIPETTEHEHPHTPGYPPHEHGADGLATYETGTMAPDELALFDSDRHDADVHDEEERERLAARLGPDDVARLAIANLNERGGESVLMAEPKVPGGATIRATHPRIDGAMLIDVYPEKP